MVVGASAWTLQVSTKPVPRILIRSRIEQIIDSTAGYDLLCFLDAFSGYHQIKMAKEDEEKAAFITPYGVYCYVCMPFGLKNTEATL
jgi:hypothetical protein